MKPMAATDKPKTLKAFSSALMLGLVCVGVSSPLYAQPVSQCGTVITSPGTYWLAQDLNYLNSSKPAITVANTEDVKIELRGRRIRFLPFSPTIPAIHKKRLGTGILVSGSEEVDIKGERVGTIEGARHGIKVIRSEDVKVDSLVLRQNNIALSYEGGNTEDNRVEDSSFQQNLCDLRVIAPAEAPDLDDNAPNTLSTCP